MSYFSTPNVFHCKFSWWIHQWCVEQSRCSEVYRVHIPYWSIDLIAKWCKSRLYREQANPSPGFLEIPILKGVVGQLLAFVGPAIQHYSWEDLGAGEGIEPASPALGVRTVSPAWIYQCQSRSHTHSAICVLHGELKVIIYSLLRQPVIKMRWSLGFEPLRSWSTPGLSSWPLEQIKIFYIHKIPV